MSGAPRDLAGSARWFSKPGALVLGAAALAIMLDAWLRLTPGPFSIDEVTYHLMAKNAAEGRLFIWNGFEELASPELESLQIRATPAGLSAQYPHGYALLAAPFVAVFGYFGTFVLNALAFLLAIVACERLAEHAIGDTRWAAFSAALWAFGTYAWEYALAVWPHSVATAAILGAALAATRALSAENARRAWWASLAAGACVGAGTAVRLDVVFCTMPLLAPLLFRGRAGLVLAAGFALGALPFLLLLSLINLWKWGSPLPLSYGSVAHLEVIPWALVAGVAAAILLLHQRERLVRRLGLKNILLILAGGSLLLLLLPAPRALAARAAAGIAALVVDSSLLPHDPTELAIQRTESDAVIYAGTLKKALLQSCPWLIASAVGLGVALRARRDRQLAWLLAGVPLVYVVFYGSSAWHGGMCFNMRYLLPVLPFAAIGSALALRALKLPAARFALTFTLGIGSSLGLAAWLRPRFAEPSLAEAALLGLPLLLAALLAAALAVALLKASVAMASLAVVLAGAGAGWSSAVSFDYDVPRVRELRATNFRVAERIASLITDDSLLFAQFPDAVYSVVALRERVRVALPLRDRFQDFRRLASFHSQRGRRLYAAFTPSLWQALGEAGLLEGFERRRLGRAGWFEVYELSERERVASSARPYSPSLSR